MEKKTLTLNQIATNTYYSKKNEFIRAFANAYLLADADNKSLLNDVWVHFIAKYDLRNLKK